MTIRRQITTLAIILILSSVFAQVQSQGLSPDNCSDKSIFGTWILVREYHRASHKSDSSGGHRTLLRVEWTFKHEGHCTIQIEDSLTHRHFAIYGGKECLLTFHPEEKKKNQVTYRILHLDEKELLLSGLQTDSQTFLYRRK